MPYAFRHTEVCIPTGRVWLDALQSHIPDACALLVVFSTTPVAHRDSREFLASRLFHEARYATLLVSGLTPYEEKRDPDAHFDVPRLTQRLQAVIEWARHQPHLTCLPMALLGPATSSAAVIKASIGLEPPPFALAGRAGRSDLAGAAPLRQVQLPYLSLAALLDDKNRTPGRMAHDLLGGPKEWVDVPDASEHFVEPGTLESATRATLAWFERWRPSLDIVAAAPPSDDAIEAS